MIPCPLCGTALTTAPEEWGAAHLWCDECRLPYAKRRVEMLARREWPFHVGDLVVISGPPGELVGEVLAATTPYEMPEIGGPQFTHQVRQIMHEWRIDSFCMIGHEHNGQPVMFTALRHPGGGATCVVRTSRSRRWGGNECPKSPRRTPCQEAPSPSATADRSDRCGGGRVTASDESLAGEIRRPTGTLDADRRQVREK